jgi:hypothetical protein
MHRRHLVCHHGRVRGLGSLASFAVALLVGASAHAGKYDLDLTRLATPVPDSGALVQDDAGFRSLASELGTVMAPRPVDPADSLGLSGFAIAADVGIHTIGADRSYWSAPTRSKADNVLPTLQILGRKGLWPGLEVGGGASHLFDSRMWAMMGYVKIAFHEGFHHLPIPSIAVRGSFSRLLGAKDLNMTTAAPAITVSHVFGLGKTFSLTPYLGYEALIIIARSHVLDATPNCDEFPDGYNEDCPDGGTDAQNEFVFENAGAIVRHRPHFGVRMIFSVIRLGFEAMFTPGGRRDGEVDGTKVADGSKLQQQYTFSVGLDF